MKTKFYTTLICVVLPFSGAALAQSTQPAPRTEKKQMTDEELTIAMNNPVAALAFIPFQINFDFKMGPEEKGWRNVSNFQPIMPFEVSKDWNLITRTIIPYMYVDKEALPAGIPASEYKHQQGLSDTTMSLFFSPKAKMGELVWGVGPVLLFPTATNSMLGTKKFGAGPALILLKQTKKMTLGGLANHVWSFASVESGREDVSTSFLQPFFSYVGPDLWNFTVTSETTYDWKGEEWTVPLDVVVSRVFTLGSHKVSFVLGPRYYLKAPDEGPKWGVRFVINFVIPSHWW